LYQTKDDFEYLIEDLEQNTEYTIYVQSFGVEAGDCSPHITTKTETNAPDEPVTPSLLLHPFFLFFFFGVKGFNGGVGGVGVVAVAAVVCVAGE
jgi:hypothetical protein